MPEKGGNNLLKELIHALIMLVTVTPSLPGNVNVNLGANKRHRRHHQTDVGDSCKIKIKKPKN